METRDNNIKLIKLTSKQRAQLRGLANGIDTILQIGKGGLTDTVIRQADEALKARELIKCRVLKNDLSDTARSAADDLAAVTHSAVVQVIGSKFVLYRENRKIPKEKRIILADGKRAAEI